MQTSEAELLHERASYDRFRVSPRDPATLRCEDVERGLLQLAAASAGRLQVERFAESYLGRPIHLATLGSGPRKVLLWSQMHGDEPTHTAVLLDLLSYLTKCANDPAAAEVLGGVMLMALPMLNPDGATADTRFNAQHIDVNRDSQRLETPEGRALFCAVETLRPEFGFNLHNQNARTAIGIPPKPAAVALMAPPLDAEVTENAQIRAAKQVAICFAEAVRSQAAGMIARYDAEYMPWSFGEQIQAMGVVTVLVEAGGWPGPDPAPIVEVHFDGLLAALRAIANDSYRAVDASEYDRLPQANELKLYDLAIVGGCVLDVDCRGPVRADLGINHSHGTRLAAGQRPDGKIVDLGDLGTSTGKAVIDVDGLLIRPGRLAVLVDWTPEQILSNQPINALLAMGVTTVVGVAEGEVRSNQAAMHKLPFNWAFTTRREQAEVPAGEDVWHSLERLGLGANRGKIRREFCADLAVYDAASENAQPAALQRVIVAGETVWLNGERTGSDAGTFLGFVGENSPC